MDIFQGLIQTVQDLSQLSLASMAKYGFLFIFASVSVIWCEYERNRTSSN